MPCPHTLYDLAGVEMYFLIWGPALLKCYGPRSTLIQHWSPHEVIFRFIVYYYEAAEEAQSHPQCC